MLTIAHDRPIGVAAGVGARAHYNGQAALMLAVAGVLDALSAGIMLYSGLVTVRIAK